MVGGDVVTQNRKRTHVRQKVRGAANAPSPIWWTADVSTLRTPVVKWALRLFNLAQVKHWNVDFTELFRLHGLLN